jgi:hypothetical protein
MSAMPRINDHSFSWRSRRVRVSSAELLTVHKRMVCGMNLSRQCPYSQNCLFADAGRGPVSAPHCTCTL